jgi:hypothetical protein
MKVAARVVFNRFDELQGIARTRAGQITRRTVLDVAAEIKASMAEPKSGEWYGDHQASAPGEAPAIDIGGLASSIQVERAGTFSQVVHTNHEAAPILEMGSVHMEPRPSFEPAAKKAQPAFEKALERLLDGV